MLTVLFWNMGGLDRAPVCARLAHRHAVTVLLLAECKRPATVLHALNPPGSPATYYSLPKTQCRVAAFSTLKPKSLPVIEDARHYATRRLSVTTSPELLITATHFPSKLWTQDEEQERVCRRLSERVGETETNRGHHRTLIIGDLNAHPYQRGIVSADGLHSVPTRAIAQRGQRTVRGATFRMFYNPMWQFFGDGSPGPPGTYYRWRAEHDCAFWYMFDQVLLRPELLPYFKNTDLEVLTGDGINSFLKPDGTPNPTTASDHLPILLRLSYPGF